MLGRNKRCRKPMSTETHDQMVWGQVPVHTAELKKTIR
jgi:hypothetical protein